MKKDIKVIDLFNSTQREDNDHGKYAVALKNFITDFDGVFPKSLGPLQVLDFCIDAWNIANMKEVLPKKDYENLLEQNNMSKKEKVVFKQLIRFKEQHFGAMDRFILDLQVDEEEEDVASPKFTVLTQSKEDFLEEMEEMEEMEDEFEDFVDMDFEEAFIDRTALTLTPKPPFVDWINSLNMDLGTVSEYESNTYLLDEFIEDIDKWLLKKFDIFFKLELGDWHLDKKEWPKNRTYAQFKEWFSIAFSTSVYDTVERPVHKDF